MAVLLLAIGLIVNALASVLAYRRLLMVEEAVDLLEKHLVQMHEALVKVRLSRGITLPPDWEELP